MNKLEALASIARLSPNVVRVLAQNPGKFTLQGTNTYLIGKQNPYTLIDTGEGKDEYISTLEQALKETATIQNPREPDISDIIISHWHGDHVGGLPSVLPMLRRLWEERNPGIDFKPPRLHKFPIPAGLEPTHEWFKLPSILDSIPPNLFTAAPSGRIMHDFHDGQRLEMSSVFLQVFHTPGHSIDSICIYIPDDRALYTADTVLGEGTAVFEDLNSYISSLRQMKNLHDSPDGKYQVLYPGHGPVVSDGVQLIETYIKHRLERETQILKVLQSPPPVPTEDESDDGSSPAWSTWGIVKDIYAAYPESLWLPASRNVELHMLKLERDGAIKRLGGDGVHVKWGINARL
ncbi:lactamase [Marasmius fiardii PR-910]|nr:lactamase [Marasmius fiardii PR-910]